jgi:signal transduction histidine kinase
VDLVSQLLLLYAGIILLDVVLAVMLWFRGGALNRLLFLVWVAAALSFVAQGLAQGGAFVITLGFAAVFLVDLALARLLAALAELEIPTRAYTAGILVAVLLSGALSLVGGPFWAVALPTAVAVAAPLFHTALRALRTPRRPLTAAGKTLAAACFLFCVHNLDFPFLRMNPDFAVFGFTIALFIVLALSITAPIVVLEHVTQERVRIEERSRLHERFFANVSHELRTPLTLILAPVDRLLAAARSEDERALLEVVRRNAHRLLRHINELLDLSRLDVGGLRLDIGPVSLAALAASIREKALPTAEDRKIELALSSTGPAQVFGDAHRLESVLTNLLANALDHTPEGGLIELRVGGSAEEAFVEVADTGPGIPDDMLPKVFDRFFQADKVERRRGRGAGIGLALSRELAELHGGSLTVESVVGEGTTFRLSLRKGREHFSPDVVERRRRFVPPPGGERRVPDLAPSESPRAELSSPRDGAPPREAAPMEGPGAPARHRILVVEDEEEMRSFLVELLSPAHDVVAAEDGEAALARLPEVVPDLVVSDLMMPGRSGVDLCRMLKRSPRWRSIPIILLTALAGSETTLHAYAQGADDFVTKPFHPEVLLARVRAQLRLRELGTQLVSREKLAAVGVMAAGVAHEARNPLNAVLNAARVLREGQLSQDQARELLETLLDGAERIESIVGSLDTHARPAEQEGIRPFDPRESLDATFRLLEHRLEGVAIERRYRTDRPVTGRAGPINQVLVNVIDNALRSGSQRIVATIEDAADGFVRIAIEDEGPGVPPSIADRIFDPFFTTRSPGEGTGLGLHLSRQILRESGGEIRLLTRSPQGAAFEILLPSETGRSRADHA